MKILCRFFHLSTFLLLVACSKQEESDRTDLVTFPLRGEVVDIDTVRLRITIAHEEIPDYMEAMIMTFKLRDEALLSGIEPGDSVIATLSVSRTASWLSTLARTGSAATPATISVDGAQMSRLFQPGDRLPNGRFLNQEGAETRISNFHGKVLAITFVYTRCPLPEFCILMSDNFHKIQQSLLRDEAIKGKWQLLTISFDPKFDNPRAMKTYARNYGADLNVWSFLTDPDTAGSGIRKLAEGLDLLYEDDEESTISHNLRTVIVDADGKLVEIVRDNEWKPEEIAEKLKALSRE